MWEGPESGGQSDWFGAGLEQQLWGERVEEGGGSIWKEHRQDFLLPWEEAKRVKLSCRELSQVEMLPG